MKVGIVGLGLIGGSMARSIKARTGHWVLGADRSGDTLALACRSGAVDECLTDENLGSCELLLLALRPGDAVEWVERHGPQLRKHTVVVDLCGVKRAVVSRIGPLAARYGFSYLGGHPMAGREQSGFAAATADLFAGASMILTPIPGAEPPCPEAVKAFFLDLGFGSITVSTPEAHDRIIACTSQLAHIVSSAYVRSPRAQEHRGFSAGSFRDMTRVAQLDEEMWTELFLDNRDHLAEELKTLIGHLAEYAEALQAGDGAALCALLRDGREKKAAAEGC